jgi:hypothetical protein
MNWSGFPPFIPERGVVSENQIAFPGVFSEKNGKNSKFWQLLMIFTGAQYSLSYSRIDPESLFDELWNRVDVDGRT